MKIVIAGAGAVGSHLAKMLSVENHEIVVINDDPRQLDVLSNHYDLLTVHANAASIKSLREAGVANADLFVAVTSQEATNITAAMLAAGLGAQKTIARVANEEYVAAANLNFFNRSGISHLISTDLLAAQEIAKSLKTSWQRINMSFGENKLILLGIKVRKGASVLNRQFKTGFLNHARFRVVAIKRKTETLIPGGDDELLDGDLVFFITTEENLEFVREQAGKINRPIHKVMIMGGSLIGVKTAQLLPEKVSAKIIEPNRALCEKIAAKLPGTLVINGDGRDTELLREEGIDDVDAFIAVTNNSETNILACLAAKRFGIVKTIAEIENNDYIPLAQNLDIGTIINKKLIAASYIYQKTLDASVLNLTCLPLSDTQVVEFEAHEGTKITKKKLREQHLPHDVNFGGYIRGGKGHICSGDTQIEAGDHVVVFCLAESVHKIEKLFE